MPPELDHAHPHEAPHDQHISFDDPVGEGMVYDIVLDSLDHHFDSLNYLIYDITVTVKQKTAITFEEAEGNTEYGVVDDAGNIGPYTPGLDQEYTFTYDKQSPTVDIIPQEGDLVLIGDNYYYNRSLINEDVVIQFEWSEELSSFENNNIIVTPNNLEFLDLTQDGNTYSMTIEAEELEEDEEKDAEDEDKLDLTDKQKEFLRDSRLAKQVAILKAEVKSLKAHIRTAKLEPIINSILEAKSKLGKINAEAEYAKLIRLDSSTLQSLKADYDQLSDSQNQPRYQVKYASVSSSDKTGDDVLRSIRGDLA